MRVPVCAERAGRRPRPVGARGCRRRRSSPLSHCRWVTVSPQAASNGLVVDGAKTGRCRRPRPPDRRGPARRTAAPARCRRSGRRASRAGPSHPHAGPAASRVRRAAARCWSARRRAPRRRPYAVRARRLPMQKGRQDQPEHKTGTKLTAAYTANSRLVDGCPATDSPVVTRTNRHGDPVRPIPELTI